MALVLAVVSGSDLVVNLRRGKRVEANSKARGSDRWVRCVVVRKEGGQKERSRN